MAFGTAILGFGHMGKIHREKILRQSRLSLVGVYDILPITPDGEYMLTYDCAGSLPEKQGERKPLSFEDVPVFDSVDVLLARPDVSVAVIATPNDSHRELALRALSHGCHVICEKPAALNFREAREIEAEAKRCGRIFTVHQNRRWDADFLAIKKLTEEGTLGDILSIESRIHNTRGIPGAWRRERSHGGGMLLDWGSHLTDQVLCLKRGTAAESVYCEFENAWGTEDTDAEDGFHLRIRFADGSTAVVETGTRNYLSLPRFYLRGTRGSAVLEDWREPCRVRRLRDKESEGNMTGEKTRWSVSDMSTEKTRRSVSDMSTEKTRRSFPDMPIEESKHVVFDRAEEYEEFTIPRPMVTGDEFYDDFCDALEQGRTPAVTSEDACEVLRILDAARASAQRGERIEIFNPDI